MQSAEVGLPTCSKTMDSCVGVSHRSLDSLAGSPAAASFLSTSKGIPFRLCAAVPPGCPARYRRGNLQLQRHASVSLKHLSGDNAEAATKRTPVRRSRLLQAITC